MNTMRREFLARLDALLAQSRRSPTFLYFESNDSWEQSLLLAHGLKSNHVDAFEFWIQCLRLMEDTWVIAPSDGISTSSGKPPRRLAEMALWEPVTPDHWRQELYWTVQAVWVHTPPWLNPDREIVAAWQLTADWNDRTLLAEYSDAFVTWCWATSA